MQSQLQAKAKVVQAIQEKVAICGDVQTEHVISRQSLGVGRVNHILRVHGHALAAVPGALGGFEEITRCTAFHTLLLHLDKIEQHRS